jgi:diketogulonate reductase-like aldo/keto reductase
MPAVGYGTAGLGEHTTTAVKWALQAGYRMLDSGQAREWYREDLVGEGIAGCGVVGLTRGDMFLTSKLHPRHLGKATTLRQFQSSLTDLRTDYLDLFMLHYPMCWGQLCGGKAPEGTWKDSWRALEELHAAGKARAIGVSNFDVSQLAELKAWAKVQPAVVQRNSDVFSADVPARAFSHAQGWQYQGYSSLGSQWLMRGYQQNPVLHAPAVEAAADNHGATPAAVALRWALQKGQVVIPRSARRNRIAENLNVTWFTLSPDEIDALDALDGHAPRIVRRRGAAR